MPEVEGPDVDRRIQHAGRQVARTGKTPNIQFWFYFGNHSFDLFYLERDGVGVELVINKFFIFNLIYLDWDDEVGVAASDSSMSKVGKIISIFN